MISLSGKVISVIVPLAFLFSEDLAAKSKYQCCEIKKEESCPSTPCYDIPFTKTQNPYMGFVSLEALCWKAQYNDLVYATQLFDIEHSPVNGNNLFLKPHWSGGMKLSLGFSKIFDWMISGTYTYFHNDKKMVKTDAEDTSSIFARELDTVSKYVNTWHFSYNVLDIDFSSICRLNKSVNFTPFISLRGAWLKSEQSFIIEGTYNAEETKVSLEIPRHFYGFGPRFGSFFTYKFGSSGCDLFGMVSTSILCGKYKIHQDEIIEQLSQNQAQETYARDHFKDVKPNLQIILGLNYKWYFAHGKRALVFRGAYEANYWFDFANYINNSSNDSTDLLQQEALFLHGLNFGFGAEF